MPRDLVSAQRVLERLARFQAERQRPRLNRPSPRHHGLTFDRVRELLFYMPDTGVFLWKAANTFHQAGERAGKPCGGGKLQIRIDGHEHLAHRLAWLYVHGRWPVGVVDHQDRDPTNNRISNLRDASHTWNVQNRLVPSSNNSTGFLGVFRAGTRYGARIYHAAKTHFLGCYASPELAHAAYLDAKRRLHEGYIP